MKTKLMIAALAMMLLSSSTSPCLAATDGPLAMATDVLVVRPGCFAATAIGSAVFVVALPFAAISKSVRSTADTLVVKPAKATFTRPVGDMDALRDF
jgi:hypothetical protein